MTYAPPDIPGTDLALFVYLAIGVLVVAVTLWHRGVAFLGLGVASMYLNLVPVVAVVVSMSLGVMPRGEQITGGILVLAGLIVAQWVDRHAAWFAVHVVIAYAANNCAVYS